MPLVRQVFAEDAGGDVVAMYEAGLRAGKVAAHPIWEFQAPQTVKNRIVLVGDCAHLATPNTGRGAHTALLDAQALRSSLSMLAGGAPGDENGGAPLSLDAALSSYD